LNQPCAAAKFALELARRDAVCGHDDRSFRTEVANRLRP
jgi:hypothetical protein